jgi:NADH-quinone oxidoreductase subunit H
MGHTLQGLLSFLEAWWVELLCAVLIVLVVPLIAGYIVLVERKVMADMQARLGPMRVGPHGLLQPIADAVKLLIKEDLIPTNADQFIFWFAPVLSMTVALTSMGAIAFGPWFQVGRDINIGLLFVVGISALGPLGIVLGGWASNNHYSIIGAMRSTAQLVSYETTAGFALVSGFLLAGTLNVRAIVEAQRTDQVWYVFLAPVGFVIYLIASIAETNRAPFDIPEAESELVAGYMTEYSGFRWSLYFLGEYANMIVVGSVGVTLFLGGWMRPFPNISWLGWLDVFPALLLVVTGAYCAVRAGKQPARAQVLFLWTVAGLCFLLALVFALTAPLPGPLAPLAKLHFMYAGLYGAFWFLLKVSGYIYIFMWLRFTLPRFRFDQLMRLGWHILIPLALVNVIGVGAALALRSGLGMNRWLATILTTAGTLLVGMLLIRWNDKHAAAATASTAAASSEVEDSYAR